MPLVHSTNYKLELPSYHVELFFVCVLAHRKKRQKNALPSFLPVHCAVLKAARRKKL